MKLPGTLVLATGNAHKVREIVEILGAVAPDIKTLKDFPGVPETVEDAPTFEGNALKKAREVMLATGLPALADDSGLEVDALNGSPGVLSARFSGQGSEGNNRLLLEKLTGVPSALRTARFRCAVALCVPGAEPVLAEGRVEGRIGFELSGKGGFGYDPLFIPDGHGQTFAELPSSVKHTLSHRGNALRALSAKLAALGAKIVF